jgi:Tfp pilus assembly protein FimT
MRALYWIIGGVVVVLCVAGLFAYTGAKESERAEQKAQELTQRLEQAGLRAPDQDIIVRSLGDDGGRVCDTAQDADGGLAKAILFDQLVNGASHVGRRPIIADRRVVLGGLLIVETYCPEEIEKLRETIDELKYDDVIKE